MSIKSPDSIKSSKKIIIPSFSFIFFHFPLLLNLFLKCTLSLHHHCCTSDLTRKKKRSLCSLLFCFYPHSENILLFFHRDSIYQINYTRGEAPNFVKLLSGKIYFFFFLFGCFFLLLSPTMSVCFIVYRQRYRRREAFDVKLRGCWIPRLK